MDRRNTLSAANAQTRLNAERLEARDTPSAGGLEDVYSLPRLNGSSATYPTDIQPPTATVKQPLLQQVRGRYAAGTQGGGTAQVNVYDAKTGAMLGIINPFGRNFTGGVSVATGDVTGDGVEDIVVGSGSGRAPTVKVFDGSNLRELGGFDAYSVTFKGGVSVAVGDVDGDKRADIVTGAGTGGGPHVKMFSGKELFPTAKKMTTTAPTARRSFMAFEAGYRGGVSVAAGDMTGDGRAEIAVGRKTGPAEVAVFSSTAYGRFLTVRPVGGSGASVAIGDVTGDGRGELVIGTQANGRGEVRVHSATGQELKRHTAYSAGSGVNVAVQDTDGDGVREIVAGSGAGTSSRVKVLNALSGSVKREFPAVLPRFTGGLSVG